MTNSFYQKLSSILSRLLAFTASVAVLFALGGCATATDKLARRLKVDEPVTKVFYAKYEEVESAIKQAMLKYPQRVDNTEAGIFETDFVKGDARFKPPHEDVQYSSGFRYRILIRLVRGNSEGRPAVKVVVLKKSEMVRDFFSHADVEPSDGLEEDVILYRIGRELTVMRALQKSADKTSGRPPEES